LLLKKINDKKKRLGLLKSNCLVVSLTENRLNLELDFCY